MCLDLISPESRKLEKGVGLTYPRSFKEFVDVYGGCVWFDTVSLFYDEAKTKVSLRDFLKSMKDKFLGMENNLYDERRNKLEIPFYPKVGGLFPFVIDYNGCGGFWRTDRKNPDNWPIVYWVRGPVIIMEKMTIAKMLLGFLEAKPEMFKIWGDVREYEPERIRLTEM